jgi:hypothetical protein
MRDQLRWNKPEVVRPTGEGARFMPDYQCMFPCAPIRNALSPVVAVRGSCSESYCRGHFHDFSWQREMKRRASSVVACGPQAATMRFYD